MCPFLNFVVYLSLLKLVFGHLSDEEFGALPLFPDNNGKVLTHHATICAIRLIIALTGEELTRRDGLGRLLLQLGE